MHKKLSILGAVLALITLGGVLAFLGHTNNSLPALTPAASETAPRTNEATTAPQKSATQPAAAAPSVERATLSVGTTTYSIDVYQGETVLDAMNALDLMYESREYPGLGTFIESINGKKNAGGRYWVFYVNGTSSTLGASSALIHPGDVIEWKYEAGY